MMPLNKKYKPIMNVLKKMPKNVDWSLLSSYEEKDFTVGSQELACAADEGCEVVDL